AHPADVSRVIRELPRDDQVRLFRLLSPQHAGEVLAELDDPTLRELVGSLPEVEVSRVLDRMPPEQVVDVVEELPKERADEILELMEEEKSEEVQELLEYTEGTAGRLMSPEFVAVREDATVAEAIEVIREAATEDIQRLGGVAGDETVLDPPRAVFPKRNLWRLINLGTAVLAASVIGLFESSIQTLATLAVFMPIVASMGGIATTQTATVVVRGIALGDMTGSVLRRVLWKELWLGVTTGAVNGLVIAAIAYIWKGQLLLSLILAVALLFNMLIAAVVGTLIPIALKTSRVDPAIASSVIITTFTDVFGFFSFLGLATLLIRFLLSREKTLGNAAGQRLECGQFEPPQAGLKSQTPRLWRVLSGRGAGEEAGRAR